MCRHDEKARKSVGALLGIGSVFSGCRQTGSGAGTRTGVAGAKGKDLSRRWTLTATSPSTRGDNVRILSNRCQGTQSVEPRFHHQGALVQGQDPALPEAVPQSHRDLRNEMEARTPQRGTQPSVGAADVVGILVRKRLQSRPDIGGAYTSRDAIHPARRTFNHVIGDLSENPTAGRTALHDADN